MLRAAGELGFELARAATSPPTSALHRAYFERIPVVALDGEELCEYFVRGGARARASRVTPMSYGEPSSGRRRGRRGRRRPASERLSLGVAARLSRYLQVLTQAKKMGKETISSQELSDYTHVNSTQIRRDLSGFGKFGKRGVGYNVEALVSQIRKILRTAGQHNIALIGAGHLGKAIASSEIFADHGFRVVAIFDVDPAKVGTQVGNQVGAPHRRAAPGRRGRGHRRRRAGGAQPGRPGARRRARRGGREDHLQLLRVAARRAARR